MLHKVTLENKEYTLIRDKKFERFYKKLTKKDKTTQENIDRTLNIFIDNPKNEDIYLHSIHCKVNITRQSLYVIDKNDEDTGLRIMLHIIMNEVVLFYVGNHDTYMRENRDC